jgi:hypothetical protein
MESFLIKISTHLYSSWAQDVIQDFREEIMSLRGEDVLSFLPSWDTVNIQESGESGDVSSIIRIPGTPSLNLAAVLFNLAQTIHHAHPSSVPQPVLLQVSKSVLEVLVSSLEALLEDKVAQNLALQLSFNIRFTEMMFLSREFKEELSPRVSALIDKIEFNIDPFDLSVFSGELESRVRRCCARELTALLPLVPQDRRQIISEFKSTGSAQDVSNMMNVNPAPGGRFHLLPLSALSKHQEIPRPSRSDRPNQSLDVKKPAARKRDRSPVAAAAASFFGSMSSSWFGATS